MKTLKTIFALIIILFAAQYTKAQSGMMNPVSFKLKNGVSVIVAENQDAPKVYTKFTFEDEQGNNHYAAGVTEILNAMLNEVAAPIADHVTFNEKGGNINTSAAEFNNALTALSTAVQTTDLSTSLFEKAKTKLIAETQLKGESAGTASVADLNAISLKDVKAFYNKNLTPSKVYITIAGNIKPSTAKTMVQKAFGNWEETTTVAEPSK